MDRMVFPLEEANTEAGMKAFNLALLKRRGLQVPDGVVVSGRCFHEFARHNGLDEKLLYSGEARGKILNGEFPRKVWSEIWTNCKSMIEEGPVIVRSSSSTEDTKERSFAGIFLSIPNIRSREGLLEAVKRCWSSFFTKQAFTYGRPDVRPALIIQKMIDSRRAGVGFSIDPVTGEKIYVIEAYWGFGEQVVQGQAPTYLYKFDGNEVRELRHLSQEVYIFSIYEDPKDRLKPGDEKEIKLMSGVRIPATLLTRDEYGKALYYTKRLRGKECLSLEEIKRIAWLIDEAKKVIGGEVDIEWAMDQDSKLYLLQARPVSAVGGLYTRKKGEDKPIAVGIGASPGRVRGKANVVTGQGKAIRNGILITYETNPAHLDLILSAKAVVTEFGGLLSHAAIVCRELGKPCVVGASGILSKVAHGEEVEVDGLSGKVWKRASKRRTVEKSFKLSRGTFERLILLASSTKVPIPSGVEGVILPLDLILFELAFRFSAHPSKRYSPKAALKVLDKFLKDERIKTLAVIGPSVHTEVLTSLEKRDVLYYGDVDGHVLKASINLVNFGLESLRSLSELFVDSKGFIIERGKRRRRLVCLNEVDEEALPKYDLYAFVRGGRQTASFLSRLKRASEVCRGEGKRLILITDIATLKSGVLDEIPYKDLALPYFDLIRVL